MLNAVNFSTLIVKQLTCGYADLLGDQRNHACWCIVYPTYPSYFMYLSDPTIPGRLDIQSFLRLPNLTLILSVVLAIVTKFVDNYVRQIFMVQ